MKNRINYKYLFLVAFVSFAFFSCKSDRTRDEKVSALISEIKDPFLIVNVLPGDIIDKSGALDGALPFTQEMLLSFFIDEEVTGIDYDTDVQIIVGKGESFAPNFYGIFKLKKEEAFIELMETEANATIEEKDGYNYIIKESDQYVVVWNKEFAIASNIPINFSDLFGSGGGGESGMKAVNKSISLIEAAEEAEVNEKYKTFLSNESDIAVHFEGEGFYAYINEMSMGEEDEMEAYKEALTGTKFDLFLNFNEGSIDLQLLTDLSDKLKEELSFVKDEPIANKMLSYGNSAKPISSMVYNIDLAKAIDYSSEKMSEADYSNMEEALGNIGLTVDEAKKALSGQFIVMMDRLDIIEETVDWGYGEPYLRTVPKPYFAFAAAVSDPALIKMMLKDSMLSPIGDDIVMIGEAYIVMKNEVLFASNDSLWARKFATGNTVKINDGGGVLTSKPFGFYMDPSSLVGMDEITDGFDMNNLIKEMKASGNLEETNFSIIMKDASKNALRIITESVADMANQYTETEAEAMQQLEEELGDLLVD